jgi:hypothetical protein
MTEELGPWCNGEAWCLECHNEWVAIWPLGAESLECPDCGSTDTDRVQETPHKRKKEERHVVSRAYEAWRESESYQVPMTPAGVEAANARMRAFVKGFEAGVRAAANMLEAKHTEEKHTTTKLHNYYLVSSRLVRELYKDDYDTGR